MGKMGEGMVVLTDLDSDAWIEAAVITAETAVDAQERYLREIAENGRAREALRIETVEL